MGAGGAALRILATFLYAVEFCCAGIILGIYSYFLAVLADRDQPIARDWKAVEGLSGVAVIYTIFAVLLTCCLGGARFFAFLAVVLDICFVGAFIALAVLTRQGTQSCDGIAPSPLGAGPANQASAFGGNGFGTGQGENITYAAKYGTACRLNTAAFAVSVIGAILFLISAAVQIWVSRHHQKEKKYGPSPANNYTSGSAKRKFWQRKPKNQNFATTKDAEAGVVTSGGLAPGHQNLRQSHDTAVTGTTMGNDNTASYNKYESNPTGAGQYHTAPAGTATNAYGYNTTAPVGTATSNPYGYNNTATNY